jgi:hypothetical protein
MKYYQKHSMVTAERTTVGGTADTAWGPIAYEPRDWLVTSGDETYPVKDEVFAATYSVAPSPPYLDFSRALAQLRSGKRIARLGWNGRDMWLCVVYNWTVAADMESTVDGLFPLPWIGMRTANEEFGPWLASQTDLLAADWTVLA